MPVFSEPLDGFIINYKLILHRPFKGVHVGCPFSFYSASLQKIMGIFMFVVRFLADAVRHFFAKRDVD